MDFFFFFLRGGTNITWRHTEWKGVGNRMDVGWSRRGGMDFGGQRMMLVWVSSVKVSAAIQVSSSGGSQEGGAEASGNLDRALDLEVIGVYEWKL